MSVSILIPAFRPTFLRQTIASALTQGLEDFELIVSDDSGGEALLPIVEQFRDPRLRYIRTAGRTGAVANCRGLWAQARHDRLLFLLDDDLLFPHAVPELSAILDEHPDVAYAYATRYLVDENGRIIDEGPKRQKEPQFADHATVVRSLVGRVKNPIGEFSNVLINRAIGLTIEDMVTYRGFEMRVMGDVAFFINASRKGPIVGIGAPVGSFRRHANQMSSAEFNPKLYCLLAEWELFIRGEYSAGVLAKEHALQAAATISKAYDKWLPKVPVLASMAPGIAELMARIHRDERDVLTDEFRSDLDRLVRHFEAEVEA